MKLPDFMPEDRMFARWVRAVRSVLTASEGGQLWADNVGPVATFRYDGDAVPFDVATGAKARPLEVRCLAATQRGDQSTTESGARVTWAWKGGENGLIRISAIALTSATEEYDVVLGLLMG